LAKILSPQLLTSQNCRGTDLFWRDRSPNATVTVGLGNQIIPLLPQSQSSCQFCRIDATESALFPISSRTVPGLYISGALIWATKFQLTMNGATTSQLGSGKIAILSPAQLEVAQVTADSGVARTGTQYRLRLTPHQRDTGNHRAEGEWLRLDYGGWINSRKRAS